jgi:trk system potassium uptake protein TrkA
MEIAMNILIVGAGKVGAHLATILKEHAHRITAIEVDEEVFNQIRPILKDMTVILGDGCNPQVLRDAGISTMDAVVATTGDDEDNLVVAKLAKHEFRVGRVIARVNNPKNQWLFTQRMGVDIAISAAAMLAQLIQEELTAGELVPLLKLAGGKASLVEFIVAASSRTAGQRVDALELPAECVLVTVLRAGEIVIPRGDTTIEADDRIIALIRTEQQPDLVRIFG